MNKKKIVATLLLIILFIILRFYIFSLYNVKGISMEPTYQNGDKVLVLKTKDSYGIGDIILVKVKGDVYIKRIAAIAGQKVIYDTSDKTFLVDNEKLDCCNNYSYTINDMFYKQVSIPNNEYFVLGDNINNSIDSRVLGFIDEKQIIGKVIFRYWPLFTKPN